MSQSSRERAEAGISLYSRFFLSIYDWFALGWNCRFIWQCPSPEMLEMYNRYVTGNHLDIGVGTGYFMARCRFPVTNPRLALMDLSPNSLEAAGKRLYRYNPEIYLRNALEPFDLDAPGFDSVGMMNLLHCLPGNMETKEVVLENVKAVMNPGVILFGSTILYRGVKRRPVTTMILRMVNHRGIMTNVDDDIEVLRRNLNRHFTESSVRITGCVALFWGRL